MFMGLRDNRQEIRDRAAVGLAELRKVLPPHAKVACMGYCFGGTASLELAFSGANISGAVSFHGGVKPMEPDDKCYASIMICHGDLDAHITDEIINTCTKSLTEHNVDWVFCRYANSTHGFTNPNADKIMPTLKYNEKADHRSWAALKSFLEETIGKP